MIPPSALKRAVVVPIYKSGDNSSSGNYRSISLTSCISKVLSALLGNKFWHSFTEKGLLNSTQNGFRSGRSCLSALLNVFDNAIRCTTFGSLNSFKHTLDFYLPNMGGGHHVD